MIFRARYERKNINTQEEIYKVALEEAEKLEYTKLTLDEIQAKILIDYDNYYNVNRNTIDVDLMAIILKRKYKILLGHNKLYHLAKQIRYDHPEIFDIPPEPNKNTTE